MTQRRLLYVPEIAVRLYDTDTPATRKRVQRLFESKRLPGRWMGKRWAAHVDAVEAFERGCDDPAVARHPASA